jgi:hypothetical protein
MWRPSVHGEGCSGTLFNLVKQARNEAMHQGAAARHLASNAVSLALILEDGLMATGDLVSHFMVEGVTVAELWQTTAMVRHAMLESSFSFLPVWLQDRKEWAFISDSALAISGRGEAAAIAAGGRRRLLSRRSPRPVRRVTAVVRLHRPRRQPVADVWPHLQSGHPCLVTAKKDESRLLGILTAFDLL